MISSNKDILLKLESLEKKILKQEKKNNQNELDIVAVFEALKQLMEPPVIARKRIGFKTD